MKKEQTLINIITPMVGELIPLENVPDPAFAEKMVGDGVAIDPFEGVLRAPCDAQVTMIHPSQHAISLKVDSDIEVLMHIGIDTVKLKGQGFNVKVKPEQMVKQGDVLIEFDLDSVASGAASLITPILITDMDKVANLNIGTAEQTNLKHTQLNQLLYQVVLGETKNVNQVQSEIMHSKAVNVANPTGIHARPSAHIVQIAKAFSGDINIISAQRTANAKSLTAIMALNVQFGDEISFTANGADAIDALTTLENAVLTGLGEEINAATVVESAIEKEPSLLFPQSNDDKKLNGISASPGIAVGNVWQFVEEQFDYPEKAQDINAQHAVFKGALDKAVIQLTEAIEEHKANNKTEQFEILSAHLELLNDPALVTSTVEHIEQNYSAPAAWQNAINEQVNILEGLTNPLMQQRAADLKDVGVRVIRQLLNKIQEPLDNLKKNCVLCAKDLTPSQVSSLDTDKVVAILTTGGSASSHVAIIARSLGIPMLAAVDAKLANIENGIELSVDANKAVVLIAPSVEELNLLEEKRLAATELAAQAMTKAMEPALTMDNVHIEVAANIGDVNDAKIAADNGADGIGLLRSEFLFLERLTAPTEEEQFEAYSTMLKGIGADKPAIVRTLDVGGDKPLAYIPIAEEENPFLGERGIRISLDRPEILRVQFRALLRASVGNKLRIMLPMIANLHELKLARKVLNEESEKLGITGVELGVMIEVPSAALMADVLAQEADFFSIGTNDLTQYTLAIDRGNSRLASLADNLDPAVLRMIDLTVKGAQKHNRWVGVCGGMAAQTIAQPILVGLGVDELSVQINAVAETKHKVRSLNKEKCRALAQQALQCDSAKAVKALIAKSL